MKRFLALLSALALMISATGCCCHHLHGGGACPPPPPCGPCGGTYGGSPAFSQVYAPGYATASLPSAGYVTASAPACDNCAPAVSPY